jgi:hypothetical protein
MKEGRDLGPVSDLGDPPKRFSSPLFSKSIGRGQEPPRRRMHIGILVLFAGVQDKYTLAIILAGSWTQNFVEETSWPIRV